MHYTDDQLSKYLRQLEASPHRPSDFDAAQLRTYIKVADVELERLEIEITLLLAKRSQVISRVNRCRSSLVPYNKLPPELIREIILFGIPIYLPSLPFIHGKTDFRLQITQICASWRRVAFSMPELWSVHLEYRHHNPSAISLASSFLSQCFSPQFKLSTLYQLDVPSTELVTLYSHKFRSLSLPIIDITHWTSFCSLPFNMLVTLSLDLKSLNFDGNFGKSISAPFLREVEMEHIHDVKILPEFPWEQLTSVKLSGKLTTDHILAILPRCTSLQTCSFQNITLAPVDPTKHHTDTLLLPHLTSLYITFRSPEFFGWLRTLVIPNLSSLAISSLPHTPQPLHDLTRFIETVSTSLRHFEIEDRNVFSSPDIDFIDEGILRGMPLVTEFFLERHSVFATGVLKKIGAGELLPSCEHLHLVADEWVTELVDALITRQLSGPMRLKKLNIYSGDSDLDCDHLYRVDELQSLGLDVNLDR